MTKETDPIMEDVYANRRAISAAYGNDPDAYIADLREDVRKAQELGMSYVDYCISRIGKSAA